MAINSNCTIGISSITVNSHQLAARQRQGEYKTFAILKSFFSLVPADLRRVLTAIASALVLLLSCRCWGGVGTRRLMLTGRKEKQPHRWTLMLTGRVFSEKRSRQIFVFFVFVLTARIKTQWASR